ncbi:MAG: hypothetical protein CMO80_10380 [Verrucomicrobiales bacterium]|nr:hypothetical protein [Verrucomicrobiales bacterium]
MADLLIFHGGLQMGFDRFDHNPVEYARSVRLPALVLNAERDRRAPPSQAKAVFHALQGPKSRFQFARHGHVSLCEAEPAVWKAVIGSFLDEVQSLTVAPSPIQPELVQ